MSLRKFGLFVLVATFGCSDGHPPRYAVKGQVVFPDGKPVTSGTIEFQSVGQDEPVNAHGEIGSDGKFELGTFTLNDGVMAGRYQVVVINDGAADNRHERPGFIPPQLVHPRHRQFTTSGLEFTVEPKDNEFTVHVDYAKKAGRR